MRGRLLLLTVLMVIAALAAALNWEAMRTSLRLELLVTSFDVAVGWVLLTMTLVPALVLLVAGLIDQARALRRVDALERQLEHARDAAERARSAEIEALERSLEGRLEGLREAVAEAVHSSEGRLDARLEASEQALAERLDSLWERVVVVRDELAADIAEAEDTLLRAAGHSPAADERLTDDA